LLFLNKEKMINRKYLLGILVMVLVFGFIIIERAESQTDSRLLGTWADIDGNEMRYDNGIYEEDRFGGPYLRGTYTTSGNTMTKTVTHLHGAVFGMISPLPSQWHTVSEAISRLRNHPGDFSGMVNFLEIVRMANSFRYAINDDILTFPQSGGTIGRYTRVVIISENELLGVWVLHNTSNIARSELPSSLEFFSNRTAFLTSADGTVTRIGWDFPSRNRLRLQGRSTADIEITEDGRLLTFHYDGRDYPIDARPRRGMYRKQ
jgi:hypothetical protein